MLTHKGTRLAALMLLLLAAATTAAQETKNITVKPNTAVELDRARCIVQPITSPGAVIATDPQGMMYLHYTAPAGQTGQVTIVAQVGPALVAGACAPATERRYIVGIDSDPQIPQAALGEAFRVLVAALVLAVLLESAFELLFNWRLFQEFFVGKAWRTPIMFGIALLVLDHFGFDPLAQVFNAYRGGVPQGKDNWLTASISAMILAGGSVGINRIMTSLGFRSPLPKIEQERTRLSDSEAYLSVTVHSDSNSDRFTVNVSEMPAVPGTPQVLGIIGSKSGGRLRALFFPTSLRVPRSGGIRVAVEKTYCISVTKLSTGDRYNIYGKDMSTAPPALLRFAPHAFVDIVIVIEPQIKAPLIG